MSPPARAAADDAPDRLADGSATIWAISDLHYGKIEHEAPAHLAALHRGLPDLTRQAQPAVVLLVGDIVDNADPALYATAQRDLARLFPELTLFPAIGNHEFEGVSPATGRTRFCECWNLTHPFYRCDIGQTPLLILDMTPQGNGLDWAIPDATLAWLEQELAALGSRFTILAEHCPPADTVGDRDSASIADYSTTNPDQSAFRLANSAQLRALLARCPGPRLFLSGHTHSGWEAPGLVKTESLSGVPVTFVNLMSPYFTGIHSGHNQPEVVMLWQVDISPAGVRLTAHDLLRGGVVRRWEVPLR